MRLHLILILISSFLGALFAQDNVPKAQTSFRPSLEARVFKRQELWDYVADYRYRPDAEGTYNGVTLSVRRRLPHHITLGVYGRYTIGERHGHTWIKDPADNKWKWRDSDSDTEFNLGGFVQGKRQMTDKLFFELRTGVERHFDVKVNFWLLRPGIIWQMNADWMSYFRYEFYRMISKSVSSPYKQGLYVGALYSAYSPFIFGPFVRYERQEWSSTKQFTAVTGRQYRIHHQLYSLGGTFIFSF